MIKLIAADVDGTLLNSKHEISPETCRMIHAAQERGVRFAIASGRIYRDIRVLLDRYKIACECVSMNGAEYFDQQGNCIEGIYIGESKAREILSVMRSSGKFAVEIYTDQGCYTLDSKLKTWHGLMKRARSYRPNLGTLKNIFYALRNDHLRQMHYIKDLDVFMRSDRKIAKFISFGDDAAEIQELYRTVEALGGVAVSASFRTNIEVNDEAATKGYILQRIAKKAGLREDEVMVVGDGLNDLSMFQAFPSHSAAMGNAIPEIKAAAAFVTKSQDESGVAVAIERALAL